MKTPERFNRAIKALVQGFFNDTLLKGDCRACAVGNILAAAHGVKLNQCNIGVDAKDRLVYSDWAYIGSTPDGGRQRRRQAPTIFGYIESDDQQIELALNVISMSGYSEDEILMIENAFETNTSIHVNDIDKYTKNEIMQDQFNGLMAVVEVLCEIDNIEPTEYKKAFEYTADFKPVHELAV